MDLGGVITTGGLGSITDAGGVVAVTGTLNNAGSTLNVGAGQAQGTLTLAGGTISGGTIADAGSGLVFDYGTLSGLTYDGPLNLAASSSSVTISSAGIVLKGAGGSGNGTVTLSGSGARLDLQGTQTLDNATVNLTASGAYLSQVSVGTLTLGANLTLNDTSASGFEGIRGGTSAGYAVINKGAINVTKSTASFYIYSENFTNQGNIDVSNGGTLHIDNATDGLAWSNAGQITASGGGTVDLGGKFSQPRRRNVDRGDLRGGRRLDAAVGIKSDHHYRCGDGNPQRRGFAAAKSELQIGQAGHHRFDSRHHRLHRHAGGARRAELDIHGRHDQRRRSPAGRRFPGAGQPARAPGR